jgi:hypothetical protein
MDRKEFFEKLKDDNINPQIKTAVKKKDIYTVNGLKVFCKDLLDEDRFPKKSLLSTSLVKPDRGKTGCVTQTKFGDHVEDDHVDVKISNSENPDAILVKGPLGEVYRQKNVMGKWSCKSSRTTHITTCEPIDETRKVLEVTQQIMDICAPNSDIFQIKASYGGEMEVKLGDWLVVNGDNFYKIFSKVFYMTYEFLDQAGGKKKTKKKPTPPTRSYTVTKCSIGSPGGRYSSRQGPAAAARKAASQRFQTQKTQTTQKKTKITLTIRQLGTDKEFSYAAKREKLAKPVVRKLPRLNGTRTTVTSKYHILIKAS